RGRTARATRTSASSPPPRRRRRCRAGRAASAPTRLRARRERSRRARRDNGGGPTKRLDDLIRRWPRAGGNWLQTLPWEAGIGRARRAMACARTAASWGGLLAGIDDAALAALVALDRPNPSAAKVVAELVAERIEHVLSPVLGHVARTAWACESTLGGMV